jgi:hypothetical protein
LKPSVSYPSQIKDKITEKFIEKINPKYLRLKNSITDILPLCLPIRLELKSQFCTEGNEGVKCLYQYPNPIG